MQSDTTNDTFKLFDIHGLPDLGVPINFHFCLRRMLLHVPKLKANMDISQYLLLSAYVHRFKCVHTILWVCKTLNI